MVTSTLEADASEDKLLVELNLDPRTLVMSHMPFVPLLLAWAEQVLGVAADGVVLGDDSRSCVEVVPL